MTCPHVYRGSEIRLKQALVVHTSAQWPQTLHATLAATDVMLHRACIAATAMYMPPKLMLASLALSGARPSVPA